MAPPSEYTTFEECRYVSSSEAAWRLQGFDINGGEPAVTSVGTHLPQCDSVTYEASIAGDDGPDNPGARIASTAAAERCVSEQTRYLLRPATPDLDPLGIEEYFSKYSHAAPGKAAASRSPVADQVPGPLQHLVWKRRHPIVVRVYDKRPTAGEEYYLRKLLLSCKGVRSYRDLATVGATVHTRPDAATPCPRDSLQEAAARQAACGPAETFDPVADVLHVPSDVYDFRAAAIALGIVNSDHEQRDAMQEAVSSGIATPASLRCLFLTLLIDCACETVDTPTELFETFWQEMALDYLHVTTAARNVLCDPPDVARTRLLCALRTIAARSNRTLTSLQLPEPSDDLPTDGYDDNSQDGVGGGDGGSGAGSGGSGAARGRVGHGGSGGQAPVVRRTPAEYLDLADRLEVQVRTVADQAAVYDAVMGAVHANQGACIFVDAPAGRGKSFVLNALLARVRGNSWAAVATASTAIVANSLDGGTTCHRGFGLPVSVSHDTLPDTLASSLKADSAQAQVLATARLIVLDEITMLAGVQLHVIDALLRTLRGTVCTGDECVSS